WVPCTPSRPRCRGCLRWNPPRSNAPPSRTQRHRRYRRIAHPSRLAFSPHRRQISESRQLVRDGIYEAVVLLLDRLHLFVEFGLLICPITAEVFKEADHAVLPKSLYIGRIDVHAFHDRDSLLFLFCRVKFHFSFSFR